MKPLVLLLVVTICLGCGQNKLPSSGVAEVDQTADFLKHVVTGLRNTKRFTKASDIANYLTSAQGSAEYWPPSKEYERDAAENYQGPRPGDGVGVWGKPWADSPFPHHIIITSNDTKNVVILSAFKKGATSSFFKWEI